MENPETNITRNGETYALTRKERPARNNIVKVDYFVSNNESVTDDKGKVYNNGDIVAKGTVLVGEPTTYYGLAICPTESEIAANKDAVSMALGTVSSFVGEEKILEWIETIANQKLVAVQLKQGDDCHSMEEKLALAKAFIANGFGESRGSGKDAKIAALESKNKRMTELMLAMSKPGANMAEILAEVTRLNS